jgi:very-short-patch-repair endonuclease
MRWIGNKEQHAYMRMRQEQNRDQFSRAEEWVRCALLKTKHKWTRQAIWGCRIFDFWNHSFGIAIEVDGQEHDHEYDAARDAYNYWCSGILVLRVRNFVETDLQSALEVIGRGETLQERKARIRAELGLAVDANRKEVLKAAGVLGAHCSWKPQTVE